PSFWRESRRQDPRRTLLRTLLWLWRFQGRTCWPGEVANSSYQTAARSLSGVTRSLCGGTAKSSFGAVLKYSSGVTRAFQFSSWPRFSDRQGLSLTNLQNEQFAPGVLHEK